MSRLMTDDLVQRLAVREDLARLNGFVELRRITFHGLEFFLEGIGNVDDESRLDVVFAIRHAVYDLARSPHWNFRLDFFQSRNEACVANELRARSMIRVLSLHRRRDDDCGTEAANSDSEERPRKRCVRHSAVGESKILACRESHYRSSA